MDIVNYDREKAVAYAHAWAFGRNPRYFDFNEIGGDCTNFASQCVYAGAGIMNYTPVYGWYYRTTNDRTASWTGVEFFYQFMTRNVDGAGPFMEVVPLSKIQPGDVIQLKFGLDAFQHNPVVVAVGKYPSPENVIIAAHTFDSDNRPLNSYNYTDIRPLHVLGVRK